jgi:exodeoxyribonuclease VII small subunit
MVMPDSELDEPGVFPRILAVPTPPKSTQTVSSSKAAMPFEEAMSKLESVVEAMESGELPLESLIAKYEEGVKLAKVCQEKLAEAELKIQQLEKSAAGELKLKPLALGEE